MDNIEVSAKTCVLKMQLKCESCQRKVKKMLKKIHGVHSISVDANEGKVAVSSTVDPQLLIAMLAMAGKRAELLWDPIQTPMSNQNPHIEQQFRNPRNSQSPPAPAGGNSQAIEFDHEQLQELAKIKGLKHVELRYCKNIKLTFKDQKDDMNHAHYDPNEVQAGYSCPANHCNSPATRSGNNGYVTKNVPRKCCHGASGFGNRFMEEPIKPMPHYGPPVPVPNYVHPFATPPSNYYAHYHQAGDVNCRDDDECAVM